MGALDLGRARFKGSTLANFKGRLRMTRGVLDVEALDFDVSGGRVSAAGRRLDLGARYTGYTLRPDTDKINLGRALSAHSSAGAVFDGRVANSIDLRGRGLALAKKLLGF